MVLKRPFHWLHWRSLCIFIVQVSWETQLFDLIWQFYSEHAPGKNHLSVTPGKTLLSMFIVQVFQRDGAPWVDTIVLLGRWSQKDYSLVTLQQTAQHVHCLVLLWERGLQVDTQFYSEDGPEVVIHWWHWGRDFMFIIQNALKLVEIYFRDCLEMVGKSFITQGDTVHSDIWFISCSWNAYLCATS